MPVASCVSVWSMRSAISLPAFGSPATRCSSMIYGSGFFPLARPWSRNHCAHSDYIAGSALAQTERSGAFCCSGVLRVGRVGAGGATWAFFPHPPALVRHEHLRGTPPETPRHWLPARKRRKSAREPKGSRQARRGHSCQAGVMRSTVTPGHHRKPRNIPVGTHQDLDNRSTTCRASLTPSDRGLACPVDEGG